MDLLEETLLKYKEDFPNTQIYIMDNGNQNWTIKEQLPSNFHFINNEKNIGVAASWTRLLNLIYEEHEFALIMNDDIYFGKKEHEVLNYINAQHQLFSTTTGTWCNFLLNFDVFLHIGDFDENFFPAYFEDNDYAYRLKLEGITPIQTNFLNPEIYRNSMTIEKQPELNQNFEKNKQYYIQKWGGLPGEETRTTEFF
jgi:GT2 family glycosyltransferase